MDASDVPPPQKKMIATHKLQHIPAEMVEEILLKLPVKSLLRFSSVSKSWYSTIFGSAFRKRYRSSAALPGRERIVEVVPGRHIDMIVDNASTFTCPVSSISSSSSSNVDATDFECPFGNPYLVVVASCGDLWLVQSADKSLILWNPSMRRYKQVPNSDTEFFDLVFGLGYECVGDDYKILRISFAHTTTEFRAQLYSLRSDSWRNIQDYPTEIGTDSGSCAFVSGKLHLILVPYAPTPAIICFDLLTEKFGEVALPNYSLESKHIKRVSVLRGMLCVSIYYSTKKYCEIWVMEEYGVAGSWTKKFTIAHFNDSRFWKFIVPLYVYENGEILLIRYFDGRKAGMFVYNEDEKSRSRDVSISDNKIACCRFVYVDSLVAPALLVNPKMKLSTNKRDRSQT